MPTPDVILAGLTALANEWRTLAIAWHVVLGLAIAATLAGWRPSQRTVACGLTVPLASVGLLAWRAGNPFNAFVFAFLALVLLAIGRTLPAGSIHLAPRFVLSAGGFLLLFAWTYPHFISAERWTTYLYASPVGLVPCPTLAAVVGVSLSVGLFRSVAWTAVVAAAAFVYGVIGVAILHVTLDYGLVAGAGVLAVISGTVTLWRRSDAVSRGLPAGGSAVSSRS